MVFSIEAISKVLEELLNTYETYLEEQTTTELVRDKQRLKRASNLTEQILLITDKYTDLFDKKDLLLYNKYKKKFLKVN